METPSRSTLQLELFQKTDQRYARNAQKKRKSYSNFETLYHFFQYKNIKLNICFSSQKSERRYNVNNKKLLDSVLKKRKSKLCLFT